MLQVTTSIRVSSVAMTNIAILGVDGSPVKGGIGEPEIYHPVSGITNLLVAIIVTGCGVGYIAIKLKIIENILRDGLQPLIKLSAQRFIIVFQNYELFNLLSQL